MINVILSTYNEALNIKPMLKALKGTLQDMDVAHRIIVVDGNSPDGTAVIAERLGISDVLIIRERCKSGLGNSYIEGLKHCIYEHTVILDADFQHDPFMIPKFYSHFISSKECDIVTGTRYAHGGMVAGWPFRRKLLSLLANNIARYVIGLKTSDLTGSFRCYRTSVARQLFPKIHCRGFGFQMEVMARAEMAGMNVVEVPIVFYNRIAGESKLGSREILLFLWAVIVVYLLA